MSPKKEKKERKSKVEESKRRCLRGHEAEAIDLFGVDPKYIPVGLLPLDGEGKTVDPSEIEFCSQCYTIYIAEHIARMETDDEHEQRDLLVHAVRSL
jgi:hypothetical protein